MLNVPFERFTKDTIQAMEKRFRAAFINSLSGCKSANLVGSRSAAGVDNLALISSVFHLGTDPALQGMIIRPHRVRRDTLENIQQTGYFTVNHVNREIVRQAHQTSARYEADVSEFEVTGLSPYFDEQFQAPYVAEAKIKFGLKLEQIQPLAINETVMVIGSIQQVLVANRRWLGEDGYLDIEAADSLAVSSLDGYHTTTSLGRFEYAKSKGQSR